MADAKAPPANTPSASVHGLTDIYRYATLADKALLCLGMLCTLVLSCGLPAINVVFGDLADEIFVPDLDYAGGRLMHYAKIFGIVAGICAVAAVVQMATYDAFAEKQAPRIRSAYFLAILRQDSSWFDRLDNGGMGLPASIAADTQVIKDGIGFKMTQAVQMSGMFVVSFVGSYIWGWQMALVMTAVIPVMSVAGAWAGSVLSKAGENESAAYAEASGSAVETLRCVAADAYLPACLLVCRAATAAAALTGMAPDPVATCGPSSRSVGSSCGATCTARR
jgi:ATP-binding cassette subfamily B (MDR/TAP) protein 1|eukprot:COSAG01_NODE_12379_length_1750_cov_3.149606_2_plen_279_part_00